MKENMIKEKKMNIVELSADQLDSVTGGGMYIGIDYPKPGTAAAQRFAGNGALGPGMGPGMRNVPPQECPLKNPMLNPTINSVLNASTSSGLLSRKLYSNCSDSAADGTAE